jgi:hypothetical protein
VVIGDPIPTAGRDPHEVAAEARERLAAMLPRYQEPAGRKPLRRLLTRLLY